MRWETVGGPLEVTHVTARGLTGASAMITQGGWLMGLTISNADPANPLVADFYDGNSVGSEWLFTVRLAVDGTTRQSPGLPGVPIEAGVFVNVTSGIADVAVTVGGTR